MWNLLLYVIYFIYNIVLFFNISKFLFEFLKNTDSIHHSFLLIYFKLSFINV